jgi:hypothetical protein
MSFPSLSERPLSALDRAPAALRSGERSRPDPGGREPDGPAVKPAPSEEPVARDDSGLRRLIVSVDLAALTELGERGASQALPGPTVVEFLAAFASLLSSVSSGDVISARDAANILQLELFGGPRAASAGASAEEDAPLRMLEDLVALIRFARQGDLGAAEAAAGLMAQHMQTALLAPAGPPPPSEPLTGRRRHARLLTRREPETFVQDATAAYEMLMDPDAGASAA